MGGPPDGAAQGSLSQKNADRFGVCLECGNQVEQVRFAFGPDLSVHADIGAAQQAAPAGNKQDRGYGIVATEGGQGIDDGAGTQATRLEVQVTSFTDDAIILEARGVVEDSAAELENQIGGSVPVVSVSGGAILTQDSLDAFTEAMLLSLPEPPSKTRTDHTRAPGATPTVPIPLSRAAAVPATCVPWPSESMGSSSSL